MTEQTEAQRLADKLEDVALNAYVILPAVAELRRLESMNAQLLAALKYVLEDDDPLFRATAKTRAVVRAAITKATGEAK